MVSLERISLYKGYKFLSASAEGACNASSHQRIPLCYGQNCLQEGVSLLKGDYCNPMLQTSYRTIWDKCAECPPKLPLTLNVPPIWSTITPLSPKFHYISLFSQPFSSAPITPQMTVSTKGQRYPIHIWHNYPRVPNCTPFRSTAIRFRVTCQFETTAPNEPKMTWTLKGQRYSIYISQLSPSRKFPSFSLHDQPFSSYMPVWDKCTPQITLNTKRSKVPRMHITTTPRVPNLIPFRSTASRFWVTGKFETSAPNDLKMTLNTKRLKVYL